MFSSSSTAGSPFGRWCGSWPLGHPLGHAEGPVAAVVAAAALVAAALVALDPFRTEIGGPDDVAVEHLGRAAFEDQAAEVEHVDVGADLAHEGHVVLDQQDARAPLGHHPAQHVAEAHRL